MLMKSFMDSYHSKMRPHFFILSMFAFHIKKNSVFPSSDSCPFCKQRNENLVDWGYVGYLKFTRYTGITINQFKDPY